MIRYFFFRHVGFRTMYGIRSLSCHFHSMGRDAKWKGKARPSFTAITLLGNMKTEMDNGW